MSASDASATINYAPFEFNNYPERYVSGSLSGLVFTPSSEDATYGWAQPFTEVSPYLGTAYDKDSYESNQTFSFYGIASQLQSSLVDSIAEDGSFDVLRYPQYSKYSLQSYKPYWTKDKADNDIQAGNVVWDMDAIPNPISTYGPPIHTLGTTAAHEQNAVRYYDYVSDYARSLSLFSRNDHSTGHPNDTLIDSTLMYYKGKPISITGLTPDTLLSIGLFRIGVEGEERTWLLAVEAHILTQAYVGSGDSRRYNYYTLQKDVFRCIEISNTTGSIKAKKDAVWRTLHTEIYEYSHNAWWIVNNGTWTISSTGVRGTNVRVQGDILVAGDVRPYRYDFIVLSEKGYPQSVNVTKEAISVYTYTSSNNHGGKWKQYKYSVGERHYWRVEESWTYDDAAYVEGDIIAYGYRGDNLVSLVIDVEETTVINGNTLVELTKQEENAPPCATTSTMTYEVSVREVIGGSSRVIHSYKTSADELLPYVRFLYIDVGLGVYCIEYSYHWRKRHTYESGYKIVAVWVTPDSSESFVVYDGSSFWYKEDTPPQCATSGLPYTGDPRRGTDGTSLAEGSGDITPRITESMVDNERYVDPSYLLYSVPLGYSPPLGIGAWSQRAQMMKKEKSGIPQYFISSYHGGDSPNDGTYHYPPDLLSKFGLTGNVQLLNPIKKI